MPLFESSSLDKLTHLFNSNILQKIISVWAELANISIFQTTKRYHLDRVYSSAKAAAL